MRSVGSGSKGTCTKPVCTSSVTGLNSSQGGFFSNNKIKYCVILKEHYIFKLEIIAFCISCGIWKWFSWTMWFLIGIWIGSRTFFIITILKIPIIWSSFPPSHGSIGGFQKKRNLRGQASTSHPAEVLACRAGRTGPARRPELSRCIDSSIKVALALPE